jgi:hypothetical protein
VAGRRLLVLLFSLAVIAVPAGVLRAACAGRSCQLETTPARVPFCPLPEWMKTDVAAGYREGRSPDVLAAAERSGLSTGERGAPWPSVADGPTITRVPIAFWGRGVHANAVVPSGTTLDAIAPTIADAIGLRRRHPRVRSGRAVPGVAVTGLTDDEEPRLVVEIALEGVGSRDVRAHPQAWRELTELMRAGAGTGSGDTGSLPLDPAATMTTIGTGGLPEQHGITGALIRGDDGGVVAPWSEHAPPSVIATLGDDLDHATHNAARIGLVAASATDRGLIGGTWYPNGDRDDMTILLRTGTADIGGTVASVLSRGYGIDRVPDLLGVVLDGRPAHVDRELHEVVAEAEHAARGAAMVVIAGTGTTAASGGGITEAVAQVEDDVPGDAPVVSGVAAGGLFLDQQVMAREGISGQTVADALFTAQATDGDPLFGDAFQGFAVSFARYC